MNTKPKKQSERLTMRATPKLLRTISRLKKQTYESTSALIRRLIYEAAGK